MKRTFKAGLLTVCMTALATAPIVTITTLATTDAAYAKGGNGNGNGGGGGNGGGNSSAGGKGHGQDKAASARSGGKDAKGKGKAYGQSRSASKGGPKTIGEFFQRLTGQDKKASRTITSRGNSAKKTVPTEITEAPAKRGGKRIAGMHPSQLGNMNAAYNANINAVLAHIRNGNTNGPVGVVAGLAVAKIEAEGHEDVLNLYNAYLDLDEAFLETPYEGSDTALADYLQSIDTAIAEASDPNVDAALEAIAEPGTDDDPDMLQQNLLDALAESDKLPTEDKSLETYLANVAKAEEAARIDAADTVIATLPTEGDGNYVARPSDDELVEATVATENLTLAELAVIETWNKSEAANEEDTAQLLEALHGRITDNEDVIRSTVDATTETTDDGVDGDIADCEDGDLCGEGGLEELASAD